MEADVLVWIISYLNSRRWHVSIDDHYSIQRPLEYGVPQGFVLSPLFIVMYVAPHSYIVVRHSMSKHFLIPERCIAEVQAWMTTKMMLFNDDNTDIILFGTNHIMAKLGELTVHIVVTGEVPSSTLTKKPGCAGRPNSSP